MELIAVNGTDRSWTRHRWILWFGPYSPLRLMVWANSLDDALDICVERLVDTAPGLLADEEVAEEYARGLSEGLSEEDAMERAEQDTTCSSSQGIHHLNSEEWGILLEDPNRDQILALKAA